jgi:hypothetical protein
MTLACLVEDVEPILVVVDRRERGIVEVERLEARRALGVGYSDRKAGGEDERCLIADQCRVDFVGVRRFAKITYPILSCGMMV